MSFYVRKSIRVGPLRFNLSKSGIGVSGGVRGFRVGTGPRGNYVHMGRHGLYYRKSLPSLGQQDGPSSDRQAPSSTHGPLRELDAGEPLQMLDSDLASLAQQIEEKQKRKNLWPFAAAVAVVFWIGLAMLCQQVGFPTLLVTIPLALLATIGVYFAWRIDELNSCVVLMYEIDEERESAFHQLYDALIRLRSCGGLWTVNAIGDVHDAKYHAGASHLIRRKPLHLVQADPPRLRSNISVIGMKLPKRSVYFLPDRILVYSSGQVATIGYDEVSLEANQTRFIEDGAVPRDANVVDHSWKYVNKNGSPDRRFKDNYQIPVCLYEEIVLSSRSGLGVFLQASRVGIGSDMSAGISSLAIAIESVASQVEAPVVAEPAPAMNADVFQTLLDAMCCVMVADSRASRGEKHCIRKLFNDGVLPFIPEEQVDKSIAEFITRVQSFGYRRVVRDVLQRLPILKDEGWGELTLNCIESVASSEGNPSEATSSMCAEIRAAIQ